MSHWLKSKELPTHHKRLLSKFYFDPGNPGGFASVSKLQDAVERQTGIRLNRSQIKNWLSEQPSYSLYKKRSLKFPRRKIQSYYPMQSVEIDLLQLSEMEIKENDGVRFILVYIDSFTKFLWARALMDKKPGSSAAAVEDIIQESRLIPSTAHLDRGIEFVGKQFRDLLAKYSIRPVYSTDWVKASLSERIIRTLREKITRFVEFRGSPRFIDRLADIVKSYNHSPHRSIGQRTPHQALNSTDSAPIFEALHGRKTFQYDESSVRPDLKLGDLVRIATRKVLFRKLSSEPNWSREIFVISKILSRYKQPVYFLKSQKNGEEIEGSFLRAELYAVHSPIIYGRENGLA